jgi:hypothetical protein
VKCEKCVAEGKTSQLFSRGAAKTLMGHTPYHDENGKYHDHDPNYISSLYECSNRHLFVLRRKQPCGSCYYPNEQPTIEFIERQKPVTYRPDPSIMGDEFVNQYKRAHPTHTRYGDPIDRKGD